MSENAFFAGDQLRAPRHGDELTRSGIALTLAERRGDAILWIHALSSGARALSPATAMRPRSIANCSMKR